jgi:hypothetical protein
VITRLSLGESLKYRRILEQSSIPNSEFRINPLL